MTAFLCAVVLASDVQIGFGGFATHQIRGSAPADDRFALLVDTMIDVGSRRFIRWQGRFAVGPSDASVSAGTCRGEQRLFCFGLGGLVRAYDPTAPPTTPSTSGVFAALQLRVQPEPVGLHLEAGAGWARGLWFRTGLTLPIRLVDAVRIAPAIDYERITGPVSWAQTIPSLRLVLVPAR
jgi:hypothetical protein